MPNLTQITTRTPQQLREQVAQFFSASFGTEPSSVCLAPGRINLIGEHVDYNSGLVLPFAIGLHTAAAIRWTDQPRIRACSQLDRIVHEFSLESPASTDLTSSWPGWTRYLQGTWEFWRQAEANPPVGFDLAVASTLPLGAGLSSSAALCVAILNALRASPFERRQTTPTDLNTVWAQARLCQRVEHEYANVPCGLMDQLVVIAGQQDHLLAIDFEAMTCEAIPWPADELSCLLIHTGVQHELASSEYGLRRATCEAAARKLGVVNLRQATELSVRTAGEILTDTERHRARHVTSEIERTRQAIAACRKQEAEQLGRLMDLSHASLRDDYEVSCEELDFLVAAVRELPGVFGARMTGGGFGGSLIALLPTAAHSVTRLEQLLASYTARFDLTPRWLLCRPSSGALELNTDL